MTGFNAFNICLRAFGSKVIPCVENIHPSEHRSLRSHPIKPDTLHFFIAEKRKQLVDVVNIEIHKYVFNKRLVGNGFHFRQVVRPKTVLFFQLTKQVLSAINIHNSAAKIRQNTEKCKFLTDFYYNIPFS